MMIGLGGARDARDALWVEWVYGSTWRRVHGVPAVLCAMYQDGVPVVAAFEDVFWRVSE